MHINQMQVSETTPAPPDQPEARSPRAIRFSFVFAVFLTFFGIYMLSSSRERPWGDAQVMYEVASSIAHRGDVAIRYHWPPQSQKGADGNVYAQYPILTSLIHLPSVLVVDLIGWVAPNATPAALALASNLAPALLGAATCALFFLFCLRLGINLTVATLATATLGLATSLWVYARYPYAEILQTFLLLGLLKQTFELTEWPSRRNALGFALWSGMLIHSKYLFLLSLVAAAIVLLVRWRKQPDLLLAMMKWVTIGLVPFALLVLIYNHYRWGSPLATGYGDTTKQLRGSLFAGIWGFLFSPGKSVFLYSPPLALALLGVPRLWRRSPQLVVFMGALLVPPFLVHALLLTWGGGYCWGPRYLVIGVPPLMLAFAFLLQQLSDRTRLAHRNVFRAVIGIAFILGIPVQLLGNAFYWDHFIRIGQEARNHWLGQPNRTGASTRMSGTHCNACFEDMNPLQWLPPFQPIAGHYWLAKHVIRGEDWAQAERDAPWHRYTTLQLNISKTYRRARIDWWGLVWFVDFPAYRPVGVLLLLTFLVITVGGAIRWRLHLVRSDGPTAKPIGKRGTSNDRQCV